MDPLLSVHLPGLKPFRSGKVRELFDLGDRVLVVSTDRLSAFDVVMPNGIPCKGQVLNQLSAFWFKELYTVCPNHFITADDDAIADALGFREPTLKGRAMLVRKTNPVKVECVARGYIAGSLYKQYKAEGPDVLALQLPVGLENGSRLPQPIFTPATKADEGHDENVTFYHAADIVGEQTLRILERWTLALYKEAAQRADAAGLILADTKFEFGLGEGGLMLIDEALTPDSSRYWEASAWRPGSVPENFDKQYVRDYLESLDWDKTPPGPVLPESVVARTTDKYLEAFRRLTGRELSR